MDHTLTCTYSSFSISFRSRFELLLTIKRNINFREFFFLKKKLFFAFNKILEWFFYGFIIKLFLSFSGAFAKNMFRKKSWTNLWSSPNTCSNKTLQPLFEMPAPNLKFKKNCIIRVALWLFSEEEKLGIRSTWSRS